MRSEPAPKSLIYTLSSGKHIYSIEGIKEGLNFVYIISGRFSCIGRLINSGSQSADVKIQYETTLSLNAKKENTKGNSGNPGHAGEKGIQIWMAENLKATKFNDGTAIPHVTDNTMWYSITTPAYCWYKNEIVNKDTYGALYNWYTISTCKLCPAGWHVSTDAEWIDMITWLGGETTSGGKLRETDFTHWTSPNIGATNETGFTGMPGGARVNGGVF